MEKILILDDVVEIANSIATFLQEINMHVVTANRVNDALKILQSQDVDILLLDINMPEMDGLTFLKKIKPLFPLLQVIMISGLTDHETVVESMRLGASDFIRKPFNLGDIQLAITRTIKAKKTEQELSETSSKLKKLSSYLNTQKESAIVTNSPLIKEIIRLAEMVAKIEDTPILLTGESGTGKELIAHYIFQNSNRNKEAFIPTNCASIPHDLFESEFFGHNKGSFTGASEDQTGLFELSNNGFLFLDEISEMDLRLQSKLLRVLESKEIKPIGGKKVIKVNTRIIAATNQDLEIYVQQGKFRNDLYHRLNTFEIKLPPLRERTEDIPLLFDHYVKQISKKMKKVIKSYDYRIVEALLSYDFPGNIRELKNIVERGIIVNQNGVLSIQDFGFIKLPKNYFEGEDNKTARYFEHDSLKLKDNEIKLIYEALLICNNNLRKTAKLLDITPQSLRRRMEKYNIIVKSNDN